VAEGLLLGSVASDKIWTYLSKWNRNRLETTPCN